MPELSQFEKDDVVYDLKDANARESAGINAADIEGLKKVASTIPFKGCKFVKKVDLTIDLGDEWKSSNVYITEDQDGNPLSIGPHFVIFTDYVTSISYGRVCLNPTWDAGRIPSTPIKLKEAPLAVMVTDDGDAFIFTGGKSTLYIRGETITYSTNVFKSLDIPLTGIILSDTASVSYVRIYEVIEG